DDGACSTPVGVTVVGTHRAAISIDVNTQCSTPVGVTVVGTTWPGSRDTIRGRCSTPVGVTVVGTLPAARRRGRGGECAQRLSASLWSAPTPAPVAVGGAGVLNACRRHCGRHTAVMGELGEAAKCSTPVGVTVVGTAGAVRRLGVAHLVLNACRRHCGRHGR